MEYGIQLYSLRDITGNDFPKAIESVAKIGYKFIEFAGFFGYSAKEVKKMLDDNGLYCSGTHTSAEELKAENIEKTIEYHKELGCSDIIIPWWDVSSPEKLDSLIEICKYAIPKLEEAGMKLGYHNHSAEFELHSNGYIPYPRLEGVDKLNLELDTYWAYVAKLDPVALMDRLEGKINVIHVKDGTSDGRGTPLGMGEAPVSSVVAKAKDLGIRMVVESESCTPDGITEAKICFDYLKSLEG